MSGNGNQHENGREYRPIGEIREEIDDLGVFWRDNPHHLIPAGAAAVLKQLVDQAYESGQRDAAVAGAAEAPTPPPEEGTRSRAWN